MLSIYCSSIDRELVTECSTCARAVPPFPLAVETRVKLASRFEPSNGPLKSVSEAFCAKALSCVQWSLSDHSVLTFLFCQTSLDDVRL